VEQRVRNSQGKKVVERWNYATPRAIPVASEEGAKVGEWSSPRHGLEIPLDRKEKTATVGFKKYETIQS